MQKPGKPGASSWPGKPGSGSWVIKTRFHLLSKPHQFCCKRLFKCPDPILQTKDLEAGRAVPGSGSWISQTRFYLLSELHQSFRLSLCWISKPFLQTRNWNRACPAPPQGLQRPLPFVIFHKLRLAKTNRFVIISKIRKNPLKWLTKSARRRIICYG